MKTKKNIPKINTPIYDNPSDIRGTPLDFFEQIDSIFSFTLDCCANSSNHKVQRYYSVKENGLKQPWDRATGTANFANIPFSNKAPWFKKAAKEAEKGAVIALLTTADSLSIRSFEQSKASHIFHIKTRLTFEGYADVYTKSCVLVIYNGDKVPNLLALNDLRKKKKERGFLTNIPHKKEAA